MPRCVAIALSLLFMSQIVSAQSDRRDGNWWRGLSSQTKLAYLLGVFDGADMGFDFSYWGFVEDQKKKEQCLAIVSDSYGEFRTKNLSNVTNGQISDGLDILYEDFKNRRILTRHGVWLVLKQISGARPDELDAMLLNYRRLATQR